VKRLPFYTSAVAQFVSIRRERVNGNAAIPPTSKQTISETRTSANDWRTAAVAIRPHNGPSSTESLPSRVRDAHACHRPAADALGHPVGREPGMDQAGGQSEGKAVREHYGSGVAVRIAGDKGESTSAVLIEAGRLCHRHRSPQSS